jgi:hypothetical protein
MCGLKQTFCVKAFSHWLHWNVILECFITSNNGKLYLQLLHFSIPKCPGEYIACPAKALTFMLSWTSSSPRGSGCGPGLGNQGDGNPWSRSWRSKRLRSGAGCLGAAGPGDEGPGARGEGATAESPK